MADDEIIINTFTEEKMARLDRMLLAWERNFDQTPNRKRRPPIGDVGSGCDPQNAIWDIGVFGDDLGGTFFLPVTVDGTTEHITFTPSDDAAAFKAKLVTHSKIAIDDLTVTGTFPFSTMRVEFTGALAKTDILNPRADWTDMSGASGRGVFTQLAQKGHS